MADNLIVGLTPCGDFRACCWEMKAMPSICCLRDLDTFPGFFFSTEVLGHKQIVGYQIPPFWLILETSICNHFNFPTRRRNLLKKFYFSLEIERRSRRRNSWEFWARGGDGRNRKKSRKLEKKERRRELGGKFHPSPSVCGKRGGDPR